MLLISTLFRSPYYREAKRALFRSGIRRAPKHIRIDLHQFYIELHAM
jgi:hypothetical protein